MNILDFHSHIGEDKDGTKRTLKEQKKEMRRRGVSHAVIFPLDERNQSVEEASFKLLEEAGKEKRIFCFFRFDPKTMTEENLNMTLKKGFRGVKLHPRSQQFDPLEKRHAWIFEAIAAHKKPILIHTRCEGLDSTHPLRVAELAQLFPTLKVILGHFGGGLKEIFEKVKNADNLFLETSIYACTSSVERAVEICGSKKILFGSDVPFSDMEIEVMKVQKAKISMKDKKNILYNNAIRILAIKEE